MKRERIRRAVAAVIVTLVFFGFAISPFAAISSVAAAERRYTCVWADGTQTLESYAEIYPSLAGLAQDGTILLEREGVRGQTRADGVKALSDVLFSGGLSDLLQIDGRGCEGLGLAALWQEFGGAVWYDGVNAFRWTGRKVERSNRLDCDKVVLLAGRFPSGFLKKSGAVSLELRATAEFTAAALTGSRICSVTAEAPYLSVGGAVYVTVPSGRRLIAAIPTARTLVVASHDFCDEGALLPCTDLEDLTLSFVGSAKNGKGNAVRGDLAFLFSDGEGTRVPARLKRVTVTGGVLASRAFYRCEGIEAVDACGVPEGDIAQDAFVDLESLKELRTPRRDVALPNGSFAAEKAACGCTVYRRETRE